MEVVGAEGGREGGDEGRATRQAASKVMTRGTHLAAVYPPFFVDHQPRPICSVIGYLLSVFQW